MAEHVYRGQVIKPQSWKYTRQCTHRHVSGRRCANRIPKDKKLCLQHWDDCRECQSMMDAFKPRKGWNTDG